MKLSGNTFCKLVSNSCLELNQLYAEIKLILGNLECALRYIKLLVQEQTTIVREPRRAAVLVFYALKQVHTFAEKGKMDLEYI